MAKIRVEIKSKEMIKPSSPTPNHLQTLQLSLIDQLAPPVFMPLILYYNAPTSQTADDLLKNSLSTTLVQFYPLAGRIEGNSSINCKDEGAAFCVANVLNSLAEVIEDPNPEELLRLVPFAPVSGNNSTVVGFQVNHFRCGGMAIGVSFSHKIIDGTTIAAVLNTWATNTAGSVSKSDNNVSQLKFHSASLFPPMNLDAKYDPEVQICKQMTVARRLIFDKDTIDRLRERGVDGRQVKATTRVELVSAFLWKCFIDIAKARPTSPKIVGAVQTVGLRAVNTSSIPGDCFGNLVWPAIAHTSTDTEINYTEAIAKLRTAVKQVDKSYLSKLHTDESLLEYIKVSNSISNVSNGEVEFCHFSSCIWFPFYEINFGWGTPIWFSPAALPFENDVMFLSTKCGQGIEAWVNVLEQDAAMFEQDHHFLSLASHTIRPKL
ncbi:hypothetical protein RND81_01G138600 [Saponaria officinalis]|uniref:Uncharacterized protein n=1 Tax=Saponaria officinalis TaxID=3572 RepID=A0AAW1NIP1_SAPOF